MQLFFFGLGLPGVSVGCSLRHKEGDRALHLELQPQLQRLITAVVPCVYLLLLSAPAASCQWDGP